MRYFIAGAAAVLVPVLAAWRVLYGPEGAIRDHRAAARLSLSDLLEAREREIIAREKARRAQQLNDESNRRAMLRYAGEVVAAAIRDLGRASYLWDKILASCNIDYAGWLALQEAIGKARDLDRQIEDALRNGDFDEAESLFDEAMEHKLTAIELAKGYLERQERSVLV